MNEQLYGIDHYLPAEKVPEAFRGDYFKIHTELADAVARYFQGEPSSQLVKDMNAHYWNILNLIIKIRVRDSLFESIGFTDEERLLVDFGLLSGRFVRDQAVLDAMQNESGAAERYDEFAILSFSQELRRRYSKVIADSEIVSLKKELEDLDRELEVLEERYRRSCDRRSKIYKYTKGGEIMGREAASIVERLPLYAKLQFKISRSIRLDTAEAEVVRVMDYDIQMLSELEKRLIKNKRNHEQVSELGSGLLDAALNIPKVLARINETRKRIESRIQNAEESSPTVRYAKMADELSEVQKIYLLISGRESARGVLPVFYSEQVGVTKSAVYSRVKDVLEIDSVLKKMWHERVWKRPSTVLVPGLGDGIYDPSGDILWISRRNLYPFKDSIVSAIARYRFQKTEGLSDRYREFKKVPRHVKDTSLLGDFVKEYNDCVLHEAKGFRRLPGKLQKWFRYEFAYEEGA